MPEEITVNHYLILSAALFSISIFGIYFNRKNLITVLMAIELMLLAVNLNFIAFASYFHDMAGQIMTLFVLTIAAAESAIGLAIIIVYYRQHGSISLDFTEKQGEG